MPRDGGAIHPAIFPGRSSGSSFDGDWVRIGDLVSRSDDGFFTYLGRADDMMRVGGEWVSPGRIQRYELRS